MKSIKFDKYHGNGNDFIIIDSRGNKLYEEFISNQSFKVSDLCDRNFGIGGDGVIFIIDAEDDNDSKMIIYNSDNSEAEMCGNGIRCLVQYLNDLENLKKREYKIETLAGLKVAKYNEGKITVRMGKPIIKSKLIPTKMQNINNELPNTIFKHNEFSNIGYAVSMGNPHLIFFVKNIELIQHKLLGPIFENSDLFPDKTNVHFCQQLNKQNFKVKVWERGAGSTLACGTGACAIHVAAFILGLSDSKTNINLPGGNLMIEWSNNNDEVLMTGNANKVFSGSFLKLNE